MFKRFLASLLFFVSCVVFAQGYPLPAGYLGSVLSYSYGTQSYSYSFTPTTSEIGRAHV